MAWMTEEDLTILMLYAVAESMIVQVANREKPRSKKFENAMKVKELLERFSNPKLYPGDLPDGYAAVLYPYFDELGADINRFLVGYEKFMEENKLIDNPSTI